MNEILATFKIVQSQGRMEPSGVYDAAARIVVTSVFFIWNLYEGTVLEAPYEPILVKLYSIPFWRFLVVMAVLLAANWCPRVGVMFALAVFFYIEDMEKMKRPWITIE